MAAAPSSSDISSRIIVGEGRYEVRLNDNLPEFYENGVKACVAGGARGGGNYCALIPDPEHLPRTESFHAAQNVSNPNVLRFIAHDIFLNPETNRKQQVLLFERPGGQRLMSSPNDERSPMLGDLAFRQMVESLADAMQDMHLAGVCHGSINPSKLFQREAGSQLQLGPYLALAAGANQWLACETIERMMADPTGRGPPLPSDDIYAAGVSLLILMLGRLPVASLGPIELLSLKVEKGTMMALLSGAKLPSAFSEILRGMLADDSRQRWGLDDIRHWLGGRRLGNKPANPVKKGQRALEFDGHGYYNARALANAMASKPDLAISIIEDGTLDRWLRRSLLDDELANLVAETIAGSSSFTKGATPAERMVARVCITLDPAAPVRLRGVSVLPYGLGPRLAHQMMGQQPPRGVPDILAAQLMTHWSHQQYDAGVSFVGTLQIFDGVRMLLERPSPGYGVERALYELNAGAPCLSSMIDREYAMTPADVLRAVEAVAASRNPGEQREPIDRHIAAYLLAHQRKINDRFFSLLTPSTPPGQRAIAILSIYGDVQRRNNVEPLPQLANWLAGMLEPSMERFHRRSLRDRIYADIKRAAKKGMLDQMVGIVDDAAVIEKDEKAFSEARGEYQYWEHMARKLSNDPEAREKILLYQGRMITSFLAIFAAMLSGVLVIFFMVM